MLRVLSLFSGIGAFEKALERLGIEHEVLAYCEIDKYASKAYSIIHDIPESKNLVDVTNVDILDVDETVDLITYGFPCQDISIAGKMKGFEDPEGKRTRSGLFFEALRVIDEYRPKFAIAENVKALLSKRFSEEFKIVIESLNEIGYNCYYAILNSKDFGVPQKRERVFIVSIRKDIDRGFSFPKPIPLRLRLRDIMENKVDEKYYLSERMYNYAFNIEIEAPGIGFSDGVDKSRINPTIANTIGCRSAKDQRSGTTNYVSESLDDDFPVITLKSENTPKIKERIRNLTPTECYKLMGFDAQDCIKVSASGISDTQLYKQAGNSIVVNVLEAIFTELGKIYEVFRL